MDIGTAAWLMQSVVHCENDQTAASLRDIIAFGDFVNHAIFTFAEFSTAAGFLAAAGLITQSENKLRTTEDFKVWYRQNRPTGAQPNYERERKLFAEYLMRVVPEKTPPQTAVSRQEFRAAVNAYLTGSQ